MNKNTEKPLKQILKDSAAESEGIYLNHLLEQVGKRRERKNLVRISTALSFLLLLGYTAVQFQSRDTSSSPEISKVIQPSGKLWTEIRNESKYTIIKTEAWEETLVSRSSMPRLIILDDFNLLQQFGDRPVMLVDSADRTEKELLFLDIREPESPL